MQSTSQSELMELRQTQLMEAGWREEAEGEREASQIATSEQRITATSMGTTARTTELYVRYYYIRQLGQPPPRGSLAQLLTWTQMESRMAEVRNKGDGGGG